MRRAGKAHDTRRDPPGPCSGQRHAAGERSDASVEAAAAGCDGTGESGHLGGNGRYAVIGIVVGFWVQRSGLRAT
jgi:hypothetical protein